MTSLFGGSSTPARSPAAPHAETAARVEQLKSTIQNQLALQNAQEIMNKVNEKCFVKCVPKPGTSLSSSEERCLSQCMERYLEAFDMVNRTYIARLRKERLDQQQS
ncbi:Tim10/DDP family zinc finger-domain-containing protein [Trametes polyzona]|nr:Tim10/DDP family zinc finger-domain-containing protein [Trametes polyzona]